MHSVPMTASTQSTESRGHVRSVNQAMITKTAAKGDGRQAHIDGGPSAHSDRGYCDRNVLISQLVNDRQPVILCHYRSVCASILFEQTLTYSDSLLLSFGGPQIWTTNRLRTRLSFRSFKSPPILPKSRRSSVLSFSIPTYLSLTRIHCNP
jgi:hypothetical protein